MAYIGHTPINHDRSGLVQPTSTQYKAGQPDISQDVNINEDEDLSSTLTTSTPTEDVNRLARYLSTQSHAEGASGNLFDYEKGSVFDPFGDSFEAKLWVRKFASLEDWGTPRASGVSFKDMSVFGYGTDAGESYIHIPLRPIVCCDSPSSLQALAM